MRYLILSLITFFIGIGFAGFGNSIEYCPVKINHDGIFEKKEIVKQTQPKKDDDCNVAEKLTHKPKNPARRTVNGGVLNMRGCLATPFIPVEALEKGKLGKVTVEVLVDGNGYILKAKAISGEKLLYKSAVEAAYKSKLTPTLLGGESMNVKGTFIFDFSKEF